MKFKQHIILIFILILIWLLNTSSFDPVLTAIGLGIAITISLLFFRKNNVFAGIRLTPKAFIYTFLYLIVFAIELVKANIDVAFRVIQPKMPINPGIVKVKTSLKSPMGRMILCNSITLTPGTFTIELNGDTVYIHWIDVKSTDIVENTKNIVSKFEKYLKEIYG